jgi:hypothetical protein
MKQTIYRDIIFVMDALFVKGFMIADNSVLIRFPEISKSECVSVKFGEEKAVIHQFHFRKSTLHPTFDYTSIGWGIELLKHIDKILEGYK